MTTEGLLAHRVEGDGPPLLLLNGGLMTYGAWAPIALQLRAHYRLVLCDLRGQLLSPGPAPRDLAANIPDLTALLDHLGIASTHVLGTSYGGEIGLLLAAQRPDRVRSLVAVTVADYASEAIQRGAAALRAILVEDADSDARGRFHDRLVADVYSADFREQFADVLAARRNHLSALPDAWLDDLDGIIAAAEALDLRDELAAIQCPTLVVIAADDQVMPTARSLAVAAAIPGAETRTHPDSGHALVAEDPEWLAEVALEFLARHAGSSPTSPHSASGPPTPHDG